MDFLNIPLHCQVAYTWLWNTDITREGIHRQIDEMYDAGIRAFYVLGEPENFRPTVRRTHLTPEYMSDEYLDLVYEAYAYGRSKGMYMWLYNEGGFPSGMVCGKIREKHPELAIAGISSDLRMLKAGTPYVPTEGVFATYIGSERIREGYVSECDVEIREYNYMPICDDRCIIRSDIAQHRNVELFLEMTHERLLSRFGDRMGGDITLMFDDEAHMGSWTAGLEKEFFKRCGYDIGDYLQQVFRRDKATFETEQQKRAYGDYRMVCGDLVRENYFRPMRQWLNAHGMLSIGHLGGEDMIGYYAGNIMATLREFDVPGIDAIWGQITYPDGNGVCTPEGYVFYPRVASSAARQQGHDVCVSESFAVYGSHLTPEEMRYIVNFQAVRGISLYNFMVISYDRKTPMAHQYRPNFIAENLGMECLTELNTYTARLSHILQSGRSVVRTALYYPQRSVWNCGEMGKAASESYEQMGAMLESAGVSFDIIDEELVRAATVRNGMLCTEHVTYESVFVPEGAVLEHSDVMQTLAMTQAVLLPDLDRTHATTLTRWMRFDDGEGYFVFNQSGDTVEETVGIESDATPYLVELASGELIAPPFERRDVKVWLSLTLLRGEGAMIYLSDKPQRAKAPVKTETVATLTDWTACVSRRYTLDAEQGIVNEYAPEGLRVEGLGEWPADFSGEVTYKTTLTALPDAPLWLDLGDVRHYARVYLNGRCIGELTMPPYRLPLTGASAGDELRVTVANTTANAMAHSDYFEKHDLRDVGPYHARMHEAETCAPAGGLLGPVCLEKEI
ncbi:MAG: hypothetical protein J6R04_02605 [Clostridia bacterium]|nr:hypothetical protein [Clostridia bacterium]